MGYLIWDFDGTLGYREGGWSKACVDVVQEAEVEAEIDSGDIRPHLQKGFPWQTPEEPHTDISTAEEWWAQLYPVFRAAFEANGIASERAEELARAVRQTYLRTDWRVFEDTHPTLSHLSGAGWTHLVLSNHVPELEAILQDLGLTDHLDAVYTSAHLGYEKPHPGAFEPVVSSLGDDATVWMVGDSFRADVRGASEAGLSAILVRDTHPEADYSCEDLSTVVEILEE